MSSNEINGVPVVDPNFLTTLNKNLPANQEIRVKRIYHVNNPNKPVVEPEPENKKSYNDEIDYDDTISIDSRSIKSNPASVIRTNTKFNHPNKYNYKGFHHPHCIQCEMQNRYRNPHPYHGFNQYPRHDMMQCNLCNSHAFHSFDNIPHRLPPINMHPYFNQYHNNSIQLSNRYMQRYDNQNFLPAINYPRNQIHVPNYIKSANENDYYKHNNRTNNNKLPNSYKNLFHNRNKLVEYTYDKYNPKKN